MMNGIAFNILQRTIIQHHGKDSKLSKAVGNDFKGKTSIILYLIAVILTQYYPIVSGCIYILVALMWLIPDKRIEHVFEDEE